MNEAGNRENVRGMKMAALETLKAAQSEKTSEKRKFLVLVCAGVILAVLGAAAGIADVSGKTSYDNLSDNHVCFDDHCAVDSVGNSLRGAKK